MDIAILRTEPADQRPDLYNIVEYRAALHGVRIVGYASVDKTGVYRGYPVLSIDDVVRCGIVQVVAATPLSGELRNALIARGLADQQLLSFATERDKCVARWNATADPWLTSRAASIDNEQPRAIARNARLEGPAVQDIPTCLPLTDQHAIVQRILEAHRAASRDVPATGPYALAGGWNNFIRASRPTYLQAIERGDVAALTTLLASCFRNEMTTGMFAGVKGYEAFNRFVAAGREVNVGLRQVFNAWKDSVDDADLSRVVSPPVGNPYGSKVDGHIVHPNTFLNDYRAQYVHSLVEEIPRPIVAEIGGGFGGFARQLRLNRKRTTYIEFDLPDNLLVASYFLLATQPDAHVLLYESSQQRLDPETLAGYDYVLMPHFMLSRLADRAADVFVNFISLSEMGRATIAEYLRQIERTCNGFFYHENLIESGEGCTQYPVAVFPPIAGFKRLSSAPSRWPFFSPSSLVHCHGEFLYVRRDLNVKRYLALPASATDPIALCA